MWGEKWNQERTFFKDGRNYMFLMLIEVIHRGDALYKVDERIWDSVHSGVAGLE